jgi:hypothetical protein
MQTKQQSGRKERLVNRVRVFVIEVHGRVWHGIAHTILQSLLCAHRAHVELARFRSQGSPKSSRDLPSNAGPTNDDQMVPALTAVVPQTWRLVRCALNLTHSAVQSFKRRGIVMCFIHALRAFLKIPPLNAAQKS